VHWTPMPLGATGAWVSGGTPSKAKASYWGGDIPWISAKSLNTFRVRESEDRVTELGAKNGTRLLPAGALLFLVRGMSLKTEFRMGIAQRELTFNQDVKGLIPRAGIVPEFLAYAVRARTDEVLDMVEEAGHGTGVLPTHRLQGLEVLIPDEDEQHAIAQVLVALDDKIELNHQMNHTLEEMASLHFERLMVDVDDDAARETSVQSLIDSMVLVVGDGYRAKNEELASAGLPFARAGNINAGFLFADAELLGWPSVSRAGGKISVPFDVVFTSKGTVGRFAFVSPTTPKFAYSPQLCFWRSLNHEALSPFFLYHWMQSRRFLEQVDAVKGQTDMADYVSLTDQRLMRMACPKAGEHARLTRRGRCALEPSLREY
jgi:restriction endonuclease S subunit